MQNDPITKEILDSFNQATGLSPETLAETLNRSFDDTYYDIEYYLLNTYYWSNRSRDLIWNIFTKLIGNSANKVLDFGCGCGLYTRKLLGYCTNYVGTDISPVGLFVASKVNENQKGISFVQLDTFWEQHNKYDLIFSSETLDHVENPNVLLADLSNKLASGGKMFITSTTMYHYILRILFQKIPEDLRHGNVNKALQRVVLYIRALRNFSIRSEFMRTALDRDDHKNAFTLRQFKSLAKASNLEIIDYRYFNCKDLFPGEIFKPLNSFLRILLKTSKIYGPNIAIYLQRTN